MVGLMKNTTKIMLLLGFIWIVTINPTTYDAKFIFSSFVFCILLSMYRYFILKEVVEGDEKIHIMLDYIESKKEADDE